MCFLAVVRGGNVFRPFQHRRCFARQLEQERGGSDVSPCKSAHAGFIVWLAALFVLVLGAGRWFMGS